jgi:transcriptional regulator with XRE-family HTH domain
MYLVLYIIKKMYKMRYMPARAPQPQATAAHHLGALGRGIRAQRKALGVSAQAAAQAAGMSRVTWHRIESGEPSVTIGAYFNALGALGMEIRVAGTNAPVAPAAAALPQVPEHIRLADYPALKALAWHVSGVSELTPAEALGLYERNWRHLDHAQLASHERELIEALVRGQGKGQLLV